MDLDLLVANAYVVTVDAAGGCSTPGTSASADGRIALVGEGEPPPECARRACSTRAAASATRG